MKLSALVLARNEEEMIASCLKQLDFADEIIVLDQQSSDNTVEIAKRYTDKFITSKTEDFSENRNKLAKEAKGDWLLYIDCDERLTPKLIDLIRRAIRNPKYSAYYIRRKNFALGEPVNHGGWSPDYAPRLFQKSSLVKWFGKVHESPKIKGTFGYIDEPIIHQSARNLNLMLLKSIKWAKVEAQLFHESNNPKVTQFKVMKAMIFEFIKRYILKRGFQDGTVGLISAIYQALHQAMVLTYLFEIQTGTQKKFEEAKYRFEKDK